MPAIERKLFPGKHKIASISSEISLAGLAPKEASRGPELLAKPLVKTCSPFGTSRKNPSTKTKRGRMTGCPPSMLRLCSQRLGRWPWFRRRRRWRLSSVGYRYRPCLGCRFNGPRNRGRWWLPTVSRINDVNLCTSGCEMRTENKCCKKQQTDDRNEADSLFSRHSLLRYFLQNGIAGPSRESGSCCTFRLGTPL